MSKFTQEIEYTEAQAQLGGGSIIFSNNFSVPTPVATMDAEFGGSFQPYVIQPVYLGEEVSSTIIRKV